MRRVIEKWAVIGRVVNIIFDLKSYPGVHTLIVMHGPEIKIEKSED